jgi:hypothetical protein
MRLAEWKSRDRCSARSGEQDDLDNRNATSPVQEPPARGRRRPCPGASARRGFRHRVRFPYGIGASPFVAGWIEDRRQLKPVTRGEASCQRHHLRHHLTRSCGTIGDPYQTSGPAPTSRTARRQPTSTPDPAYGGPRRDFRSSTSCRPAPTNVHKTAERGRRRERANDDHPCHHFSRIMNALCPCGHPASEHDRQADRFCAATRAGQLLRNCICVPLPSAPLDRLASRDRLK